MTRRQRRNRLSQWLIDLLPQRETPAASPSGGRRILVEPLEQRQLLAGDTFSSLLGSSYGSSDFDDNSAGQLVGEGELTAEGEDATDLVALAQAINDSGTRFFGAAWCEFCTQQKELFEDGYSLLPFIEVTNPDRSPNSVATAEGITEYPTWEFPDGTRLTGVQTIETLAARSGITTIPQSSTPSLKDLSDVQLGTLSPMHIPIDAYDPNGNPLTVTVSSSDTSLLNAEVLSGNRSLRLSTAGFGDMVFELFETRAPRPSGRVIELAESGFYDGVTFHRVIDDFVIQGGDPTGTGSGGSTLGDFDDQFHLDLQHNSTGILSYAKSSDDTNDSQFFITEGSTRHLDFNHSIFGILVEGEPVREAISETATGSGDRPVNSVVIDDATVFTDTENSVLILRPTGNGTGSATITVTVTDTEGRSSSKAFTATVAAESSNGSPFLNDIATVTTSINTPVTINLTSQDKEGDTPTYSVQALGTTNFDVTVDAAGQVTVTPPTGFTGQLQFQATVSQSGVSGNDNQVVTVDVTQSTPTTVDLVSSSDTGANSADDITAAQSLVFTVSGTTSGSTVNILAGGNIVGTATATGATTDVTVNNVAALGQGSVLFSSTQTANGQTSSESPALAVTLDNVAPASLDVSAFPASAVIDQPLSIDLSHAEEGSGLVYELISGPTAASLVASSGAFSWTPSSADIGTQTLSLRVTDAAGNQTNQDVSINVIDVPLVQIQLNTVDANGNPITTIGVGEEFRVQVIGQDLRTSDTDGIFAAYIDLLFDSGVIEPIATDPITHTAPYTNAPTGTVATGLIDELGGFSTSTAVLGSDARVIAEVTFRAIAVGNANIRSEAADNSPESAVLLFTRSPAVPTSQIDYQNANFAVGADFEVANDAFNFDEDTGPHTLDVLSNDTATGSAVLSIASVSTASGGGSVSVASDGLSLIYTPAGDFSGAETFTYTAQNQSGIQSTATVTVQVTDINDPPQALNDTVSVFRNSSQNVLEVLANDSSGVDSSSGETLSVTAVSAGSAGGTIEIGSSGLTVRYTPAQDFSGTETFTYTLSDGRGGTSEATVNVGVELSNPPPTPQNDNFTIVEDAAQASFDVLANDTTDDSTETLSVSAVQSPALGGFASVAADGLSILYRPGANFVGQEIFAYTLRDSGGATSQGLVTFTVTAVNDAPDAVDDSLAAVSSSATTDLDVLANDINVDSGETVTITDVAQPPSGSGSLAISSDGARLVYTPPSSTFTGTFSTTYTTSDGNGLSDTATLTLTVDNFVPRTISGNIAYDAGVSANEFYGVRVDLVGTDLSGNPVSETVQVGASGVFSFQDLAPGDYSLRREAIPFLHDEGSEVAISSAATDGDFNAALVVSGGLRPQYFDIRDFLSSSSLGNLAVAVDSSGEQTWAAAEGDWQDFSDLDVSLDTTNNTLQIRATNANSEQVEASLPIGASLVTHETGSESGMRLLRVRTPASGIQLSPVTGSGEGEASTSGLQAEGEDATAAGIATPEITSVRSQRATESSSTNEPLLSPNDAIRQLLSSTSTRTDVLAASSVDAAMEDTLPSLQLRLSENLEGDLTADSDEITAAGDSLYGQL